MNTAYLQSSITQIARWSNRAYLRLNKFLPVARLDNLARYYGTDKSSTNHNYVRVYEKHFSPYRKKRINLLEIGIKKGASLKMWKDYFQKGHIYGIDIDPECRRYEENRITTFIGAQEDEMFLNHVRQAIGQPLDIIIDDGSHHNKFTISSFEILFDHLRPGGIYVIEDLVSSYESAVGFENKRKEMTDLFTNLINCLDLNGRREFFDAGKRGGAYGGNFANVPSFLWTRMNNYERYLEQICFYQSICFVFKRGF